jgi:hypothetical protein
MTRAAVPQDHREHHYDVRVRLGRRCSSEKPQACTKKLARSVLRSQEVSSRAALGQSFAQAARRRDHVGPEAGAQARITFADQVSRAPWAAFPRARSNLRSAA